ncbi:hypothetical protein FOC1_g10006596 [Fusarium oxysporum f. sp. cubense race 1]|uniref:Reverse transcriptase domain-containing protein n=1 Tax=Fusarium oxysporum f. sp. cubense (strain race 1) TaxID=1229664 RepID=N4UTT6_FUSC1|nr:hypothetical protein FOC1_g10006596 [Fusarium oxysporum f. sp. cubense race 1]
MGLDITGAYDRVERVKLMKVLQEAGLPEWMLSFIWSFLTDRSTDMKLPGFTSSSFWVNMGIPQGSPLSPLLFLFFSMPIVGAASEYTNPKVKIYPFAYVDDTYLLAVSDDYEDNCKALKECHERIMVWADSVGVSFSPHKYHVMHFHPPRHRADAFKHMPKIPGLEGKKPESSMRILGVEVDHRLNWREHVAEVGAKVNDKMNDIARICNTTAGPDMLALRQLYITTVRPIISHGCGAWFIYGKKKVKWQISKEVANYLVTIQNQCLKIVTGALAGTAGRTLPKEAYVEDVLIFLERVATVQRARALDTPDHERLRRIRRHGKKPAEFDHHPYHALDHAAISLLERANESCRDQLFPNESTLLTVVQRCDTSLCDCEAADETVFHMFIQCELLATARRELYTELGHQDFYRMLSEKPEIAADWAITHFDIPQFEYAKQDSRFNSVESSTSASPPLNVLDELKAWLYRRAT